MVSVFLVFLSLMNPNVSLAGESKLASESIEKGRAYPYAKRVAKREKNQPSRALWLSKYMINKRKNIAVQIEPESKPNKK
ncbi:MAG: hypothetical protein M9962_06490 [Oligoflexia bacterium]|nr:hypothetical protein [Oligoflexia bacterium]